MLLEIHHLAQVQSVSYTYDVTPPLAPSMLSMFSPLNNLGNDATPENYSLWRRGK